MANEGETIQTIFNNLSPLVIIAKWLGLMPLRIRGGRLTRERLLKRVCCIFLVAFSSLVAMETVWHEGRYTIENEPKIISMPFLRTLTAAARLLVIVPHVYREFTDTQTGIKMIESLDQYDRKVEQIGLARKDSFFFSWIINVPMIIVVLKKLCKLIGMNITTTFDFFRYSGSVTMKIANHLALAKFLTIGHLLYQRYNHLNEFVLPKNPPRGNVNLPVRRRFVKMRDLVYLHSTLTNATLMLAKVYSFELLLWSCSTIWEFHFGVAKIWSPRGSNFEGIFRILQTLMAIGSLCWICHTTAHEANRFARCIIKTDPKFIHVANDREELLAAVYMYNHKVSFKAWHFYIVDLTTIYFIGWLTLNLGLVLFDGNHWSPKAASSKKHVRKHKHKS